MTGKALYELDQGHEPDHVPEARSQAEDEDHYFQEFFKLRVLGIAVESRSRALSRNMA